MSALRRGITIVEVAASTVLVGVVLVGSLETVGMAARHARAAADRAEAWALAEGLLAEVLARPYDDPDDTPLARGRESGEPASPSDRTAMDDVDDYHGWSASPPASRAGADLTRYAGWTHAVTIDFTEASADGDGRLADGVQDRGIKRVTVTVDSPSGERTRASALCSRHGPTRAPAAFDGSWVVDLSATATVRDARGASAEAEAAASLLNESEAP